MDARSWLNDSYSRIRTQGVDGAVESLRPVRNKILSVGNVLHSEGTSIYDREWDLLVVLDACRYDLFCDITHEYEWIKEVDQIRSVNSTTALWMRRTFVSENADQMRNTAYVCGNPFSESELESRDFADLIELWRTAWQDPGTVPPEAVTDETIRLMREGSHERVIAHYMQPHCPFISRPELSQGKDIDAFGDQQWRDVWEKLRDDDVSIDDVWEGYRENLVLGLDEVSELLANVDAERVVITSDHGNAIGEWGVYGHPPNLPLKNLRMVPWVETTAQDSGERTPEEWRTTDADVDRKEQLSALGYV